MSYQLQSAGGYTRLLLDIALILLGALVLFGIIDFPQTNWWLPWFLSFAGVFLVALPYPGTRSAGLLVSLVGVYLIMRSTNTIDIPVLKYCLGGFLVIAGVVNLIRGLGGGSAPENTTKTDQLTE